MSDFVENTGVKVKILKYLIGNLPEDLRNMYLTRLEKVADKDPACGIVVSDLYRKQMDIFNPAPH